MLPLTTQETQQRIEVLALPILAAAGVELVEIEVKVNHGDVMVAFFADLPTGGITIAQCVQLNKAIVLACN